MNRHEIDSNAPPRVKKRDNINDYIIQFFDNIIKEFFSRLRISGIVGGLPYGSDVTVKNIWNSDAPFVAPEGEFEVDLAPWGVQAFVVYRAVENK